MEVAHVVVVIATQMISDPQVKAQVRYTIRVSQQVTAQVKAQVNLYMV